ncbi:MAG: hypothetical protein PHW77_08975, partial [Eubacteriales bacterium]|nr:hypothetical protein [Eubacteriales bacterium]
RKNVKLKKPSTDEWKLYEKGREYNNSLDLCGKVATNERFYRGEQWDGVKSAGLPRPVFNIFKRIINYYSSSILSSSVAMRFSYASPFGEGLSVDTADARSCETLLNRICEKQWERLHMDELMDDALRDAAISGDAVAYTYWDGEAKTGQKYSGDFKTVLVDNTNVFFGNPNYSDAQKQPWILISSREYTEDLKAAAKANGRSAEEIARITPDTDTLSQSGDLSKIEIENTRCISLVKLWRGGDGKIKYRKSTRGAVICDTVDTGLYNYPVCVFNWTKSKNSWHGEAVATGLIENQIFINKSFAMVMKHMMDTAFSKVIYDGTLVGEWSNRVGEAIKADGPVDNVAKIIPPGQMQSGMLEVISMAVNTTKECMGATDTALGDVKPNNTSAILALQKASSLPLETVKRQFYRFIEDIGLVWLDFITNFYGEGRLVRIKGDDGEAFAPFNIGKNRYALYDCRIDVGASNYWSEIACLNTLDNLLAKGQITAVQYLKRIPDNLIPKKEELIREAGGAQNAESGTLNVKR